MRSTIEGVHLLMTYRCDRECEHCFVWAGPSAVRTMTVDFIIDVLDQAERLGTVKTIYFEGGEPFMYFPVLVEGIRHARTRGFEVGVVTNGYWGTDPSDAELWLQPLRDMGVSDLSISDDEFHRFSEDDLRARVSFETAQRMRLPASILETRRPKAGDDQRDVLFRGRASGDTASELRDRPFDSLDRCPEDLDGPGRVHIDPLGYVHLCQGLVIGNVAESPLADLVERYEASTHPIVAPLVEGGPVALVERYDLPHSDMYADACDLCYEARLRLRERFPRLLAPDEMYGD